MAAPSRAAAPGAGTSVKEVISPVAAPPPGVSLRMPKKLLLQSPRVRSVGRLSSEKGAPSVAVRTISEMKAPLSSRKTWYPSTASLRTSMLPPLPVSKAVPAKSVYSEMQSLKSPRVELGSESAELLSKLNWTAKASPTSASTHGPDEKLFAVMVPSNRKVTMSARAGEAVSAASTRAEARTNIRVSPARWCVPAPSSSVRERRIPRSRDAANCSPA